MDFMSALTKIHIALVGADIALVKIHIERAPDQRR
jgi:hypothetical protein